LTGEADDRVGRFAKDLAIVVTISILLAEIVLRGYAHFSPVFFLYDDSYNRFRGRPFADDWDFKLNSQGFKDVEFGGKQGYRIVALGDSFAFGVVPYQQNYLTLLETGLRQKYADADVLNMGIPATSPKDYLSLFIREGLNLQPDMVLVSLFIGNDLTDLRSKPRPWYSRSHVASLLHYVVKIRPKYEGEIIHGKATYCDECPNIDAETFLKVQKDHSDFYREDYAELDALSDGAVSYLVQLRNVCRQRGIDFVVAVLPAEIQIDAALRDAVQEEYFQDIQPVQWNFMRPNESLTKRLRTAGIDYLDLFHVFVAEGQNRRLYRPRDTHWNIAGNEVAARAIEKHIDHYLQSGSRKGR
jgi:hypothetical protein